MNNAKVYDCYEKYKTGLFRYALSILKDPHRAEDVLQEVFLRLLTGKYTPEPGKEQAYLYRAARNICYDELRLQKRQRETDGRMYVETDDFAYLELIAPLEPKEREIVTLKIVGGLTHREIGKIMSMTEQAVKKRYQRALQKLKEE